VHWPSFPPGGPFAPPGEHRGPPTADGPRILTRRY